MADARALFDEVIEKFPSIFDRLRPASDLDLDPSFESGNVTLQRGDMESLTLLEKSAVSALQINEQEFVPTSSSMSQAKSALKKGGLEVQLRSLWIHVSCAQHPICARGCSAKLDMRCLTGDKLFYSQILKRRYSCMQTRVCGISMMFQNFYGIEFRSDCYSTWKK